jgi:hypothetical protein
MEPRSPIGPQWGNYLYLRLLWKKYSNIASRIQSNIVQIILKREKVKRIQACTNTGQGHHQWEDNYKNAIYIWVILISSQETHGQKNTDLHESFLTECYFSFSKSWSSGIAGATIWKSIFTSVYIGKNI